MLKIQRLKRPTKRSGHALAPSAKTKVKGLVIVNTNTHTVYVDKFTPYALRKKSKVITKRQWAPKKFK